MTLRHLRGWVVNGATVTLGLCSISFLAGPRGGSSRRCHGGLHEPG